MRRWIGYRQSTSLVGMTVYTRGNYGSFGLVWTFNFRTYLHAGALVFGRAQ